MGTTSSQYEDNPNPKSSKKVRGFEDKSVYDEKKKKSKEVKLKIDQIDEEQAHQDLMAYLEIVGEHADDLPITWRDDPELGRSLSSLTAKQYAVKADAFFPCDVRVIATTSTKYGNSSFRLPSKENFYLGERALDPGLSNGGAVANSLLKVIYDFENDNVKPSLVGADANDDYLVTDNLFDDDADDDDEDSFNEEDSLGSLQFDGMMSGATLTWSELLRRMKDEMEDLKYDQTPTISTSRRFDLNEPVYLLPENFDPKVNRKFSLLIGCNYKREVGALKKSHDDVHMVKDYIVNVFGFPEDDDYMTILLDAKGYKKPTYKNILEAMKFIALRSRPGDAVFIQFSGHGGRLLDLGARTTDCYDEVIVPSDFQKKGFLTDKAIFRSLLVPMAEDVTVTIILDSCDAGAMFDLPFSWATKDDDIDIEAKLALNDNFSFQRLLNVVKQMYDTSVTVGEDARGLDSDGSIVTIGGDNDVDEESSYGSIEDDEKLSNEEMFKKSAREIMSKIGDSVGDAVQVMSVEAEYARKTGMKIYDLLIKENETREGLDSRDEDDESFYSDEEDDYSYYSGSFSSESEEKFVESKKSTTKKTKYYAKKQTGTRSSRRY